MGATSTIVSPRWTNKKDKTLEAIADLYCATPKDIAEYLYHRDPNWNDMRGVRATLDRIIEHNPHATYLTKRPYMYRTKIFGLSDSGVIFSRNALGISRARKFEVKDLDHEHVITRFHIKARELAIKNGWQIEWAQNPIDHKNTINPDAIMRLTGPKGKFIFTIEPERQSFTENHLKKGKKYHEVFGTKEAERLFGAEKTRTIFVTLSDRKRITMLEKFAEEYPYRMFWFTTVDAFEKNMGGNIFLTPKDWKTTPYSLSDVIG
jgi:hypothetical protein